jgi:hypothetical protein
VILLQQFQEQVQEAHTKQQLLITEDEEGAICSNGFSVLRNIRGVEPLFLLVYMRTDFFCVRLKGT